MLTETHEDLLQFDNVFDFDDASHQWRSNKTSMGKGFFQYKQQADPLSIIPNTLRTASISTSASFASLNSTEMRITRSKTNFIEDSRLLFHEVKEVSNAIGTRSRRSTVTPSNNKDKIRSCKRRNTSSFVSLHDTKMRVKRAKTALKEDNPNPNSLLFHEVKQVSNLMVDIPISTILVTSSLEIADYLYWISPKTEIANESTFCLE